MMNIRKAELKDKEEWARMRNALWTESSQENLDGVEKFFSGEVTDVVEVFVLERDSAKLGGFIELNVRNYAEGSEQPRVPYIEGWYIDADLRGRGYGKGLVEAAEGWATENGFDELASDAEMDNTSSIAAHKALGFDEVERIVCFLKKLK